jgi:hypothetical protein
MRLADLQPHKRYAILRAQELYMCGCDARILLHIWDFSFREGYVILPFQVLSRDAIKQINNYTRIISLPPGFDPRIVQPVSSGYTNYATRLTDLLKLTNIFGV